MGFLYYISTHPSLNSKLICKNSYILCFSKYDIVEELIQRIELYYSIRSKRHMHSVALTVRLLKYFRNEIN